MFPVKHSGQGLQQTLAKGSPRMAVARVKVPNISPIPKAVFASVGSLPHNPAHALLHTLTANNHKAHAQIFKRDAQIHMQKYRDNMKLAGTHGAVGAVPGNK